MTAQSNTKPASLPTSVEQVADQALLCIKVGPLLTYMTPDEGIALRMQLDLELARWSGGFL